MVTQVEINTKAQEISTDSLLSNNPVINSNSRLENIEGFKSVMLIYPPSKLYQRGEDRSQGNIEDSTATTVRAANDLGYAASMLKKSNYRIFLRDYQTENLTLNELHFDVDDFQPDVIFMSITNSTIFNDIIVIDLIKEKYPDIILILK